MMLEDSRQNQQKKMNQQALKAPKPGDYWHEMFCPYFVIVDVKGDRYTVLSCLGGPHSFNRNEELNARIEIDDQHWGFDYSKSMVVDLEWIREAVTYQSIEGFVADVTNTQKSQLIVSEWRNYKQQELKKQIKSLQEEWEEFTGWKYLKEDVASEHSS